MIPVAVMPRAPLNANTLRVAQEDEVLIADELAAAPLQEHEGFDSESDVTVGSKSDSDSSPERLDSLDVDIQAAQAVTEDAFKASSDE